MKMYKYILDSVDKIDWLAIGPLMIFFFFFIAILIVVFKLEKGHISRMEKLPFEREELNSIN